VPAASLIELERAARERLDPAVYDFFAGGADGEHTLRANEEAFARIGLVPRVLTGAGQPRLAVELPGSRASLPVLIAPTAFHRLADPDGERATARAAAAAGTVMIASMAATVAIEEIAAAAPGAWFQLYIQPDLGFTEAVVRRAEAAGCAALVATVDSPAFGHRERDVRHGFAQLPPGLCCENMRERPGAPPRRFAFTPELSWEHVEWLRATTSLPLALKGIMHPQDARLAVSLGVDMVLVSNHGGRQLDTVPATIDLLPAIAEAVAGDVPLLLDGGVRRGTDVVKACALGATAVAVGRPVLWGLATGGERGVLAVLDLLRVELERALILCGLGAPADAGPELLRPAREEQPC
jgi:4-hydroxymandelate oxidase